MDDMRAAQFDSYGPPEVLYETRIPKPAPGDGEVLVRVHATSVNGGELYGRAGKVRLVTGRSFPQRTGLDFAGEVAGTGAGVTGLREGDRVWGVLGRSGLGSAAEYVTVRPRQLALAPENVSLVEAASLVTGVVPIIALRDKAGLRAGERLLVRGASGGVGSVAVQLGKALGARVTGLAGPGNLDFVTELGADEALSYTTTRPGDLGRFDVVLDTRGTEHRAFRALLAPGGRMVSIAFDFDRLAGSLSYLLASNLLHGSRRVRLFSGNPRHELFAELTRYVESGALRPVVDTVRPLSEIAQAHRALEAGGVRGKHLVRLV